MAGVVNSPVLVAKHYGNLFYVEPFPQSWETRMNLSSIKSFSGLYLLLILSVYFAITIYTSWHIPLSVGPDEVDHFLYARFIKQKGYLPLTPDDRQAAGGKSVQPPLNAILVAIAYWSNDLNEPPFVKLTHGVPRRHLAVDGLDDEAGRAINIVNTEDPLAGDFLFWRFGRLMSTIFSGITLVVIYFTALKTFENFPQKNLWALAAVTTIAFIPKFVFMSGMLSYENLLGLWLSLFLLTAIYIVRNSELKWFYLLAGGFIGLAIMTKLSALPALLSLVMLIIMVGYRERWSMKKYLTRLTLSVIGIILSTGWWFTLILLELNMVAELGWIAGLLAPTIMAGGSGDSTTERLVQILSSGSFDSIETIYLGNFSEWSGYIFKTFWTSKGNNQNTIIYLLMGISALILIGLIRVWWQRKEIRLWLVFLCLHLSLFFILPLVRLVMTDLASVAGQGQHILFPAAGALAILISLGTGVWFSLARGWLGGLILGVGLLAWSLIHVTQVYPPSTPVPVRTVPPIMPPSASKVELEFDTVILKGFELKGLTANRVCCDPDHPALKINLYWVVKQFSTEDYRVQVSLVDSQGQVQTVRIGYTANGRYPSRAWEPGDIIRDELYLPLTRLKSDTYTIQLQVWGANSPLATANGNTLFTLTEVEVLSSQKETSTTKDTPTFEVWQAGQIVDGLPNFEYRSTIQVTTDQNLDLNLIGPDGIKRKPKRSAGQTHVFIAEPLWARGDYRLHLTLNDQREWQTDPILRVVGQERKTAISYNQTIVNANFANQIMLLGYSLLKRHVTAGESLSVILNWQALQTMPTDFIMFTRIRDETGQVWGGYDRWPREYYSPIMWVGGEVVEDGFTVGISPDAPDGLYYLDVGFYFVLNESLVYLPLVENEQMSDITSVSIGPFKVGNQLPAGVTTDLPNPDHLLNQPFGDKPDLTLLGYDLISQTNQSDPSLKLTLYWRAESPLFVDYTTFVHLRNDVGETIAQKDQPPLNGKYPTSLWQPGEVITDEIVVPLPSMSSPDEYNLVIGLYDLNTGARLEIPDNPENSLSLGNFTISR